MKRVYIDGVEIILTPEQVKKIDDHHKQLEKNRERDRDDFKKVFRRYGFKRIPDLPECYQHPDRNWFAEIIDRGGWQDVWMTGEGLKTGSFPGGWIYSDAEKLTEGILKGLENYSMLD